MALIEQAVNIQKAVKNVGRLREILSVLTRFGFGALIGRLGLEKYSPKNIFFSQNKDLESLTLPVRIRKVCEELGPTFVKVGQMLSGRPDLLPPDLIFELSKLQDKVPPVGIHDIQAELEHSLNRKVKDCFASFDTEALATASIAQVHAARTLGGDDVVVKIRKPGVKKSLYQDLEILQFLASLLEKYVEETRVFRPVEVVDEFKRALILETDFLLEAQSIERFRRNFEKNDFVVVPKLYPDFCSKKVLTQERFHGVKLSDVEKIKDMGVDPQQVLPQAVDALLQSVLNDGFFHADPHPGNLFLLPDSRLGLIDFGSVGRLSHDGRAAIVNLFLALMSEDYDALIKEYIDISPSAGVPRDSQTISAMKHDIENVLAPYFGLTLKEIPAGKMLMDVTNIAYKYHLALPKDLMLVFKCLMSLEGMARTIDPDLDLLSLAKKHVYKLITERYSPKNLSKELFSFSRELARIARSTPRQLAEVLRQLESGQLKVTLEDPQSSQNLKVATQNSKRLSLSILSAAIVLAALMASNNPQLPQWSQITLWAVSTLLSIFTLIKCFR